MNMKTLITFLSAFMIFAFTAHGQCNLSTTGIGNFDGSNYNQWTKYDTQSGVNYGSFTQESVVKRSGSDALKANVTTANDWQMRILTNCDYPLTNGKDYNISFWVRGNIGDKVKVVLQENNNGNVELGSQTVELSSSDWKEYTVTLTSNGNYSKGKIKLVFQDAGVYYVDDLSVNGSAVTGVSWYVKGGSGNDNTSNGNGQSPSTPLNSLNYAIKTAWNPGDIIYVMEGTYRNGNYGKVQSSGGTSGYNNGPFLSIDRTDVNTSEDNWLIITNYPGHSPKIQFDGESGIVFRNGVSYVDISGLEIEGANQKITKAQAVANRTVKHKYYGGQGLAIWGGTGNSHHIKIHHMKVHDCGGSGIRVNDGDYIDISYNEVYNCNWYTWLGSSAIVIAQSKDFDNLDKIKMVLTHNLVHDNRNFVPFYCCEVSPTGGDYGTINQNYIHDGSGVYITRNNPNTPWQSSTDYLHGWFYFANNVTYNNGINGLVVHKTDRTIVTNNIAYLNGTVDPRPVSEGGDGRQDAGGITINASKNVFMYNNISQVRYSSDYNYRTFGTVNYTASNNIGVHGRSNFTAGSEFTKLTPTSTNALNLFVDPSNGDFHPKATSMSVDAGRNHDDLPPFDFDGNPRNDGSPDIGAYEYTEEIVTSLIEEFNNSNSGITASPNPTYGVVHLNEEVEYSLFRLDGTLLHSGVGSQVDLSNELDGLYLLKIKNEVIKVMKN